MRETLSEVNGQRVVDGAAAGLLRVDAVERHRDAETCGITGSGRASATCVA